ncbi:MAG TPA: SRPBCC domain-containing protein [Acidimicrobiales bacterium]|nr:SRPBCC domain-containing protein [Acidimicrobiales bacterium]
MTDATLRPGDRPAVRLERRLPDPPEVVWRALTDRQELANWFPCDVVVEGGRWEKGARLTFPFPSDVIDMTLTGEVLAVDEPHLLSYTWGDDTLRFELEPDGNGTLLVLVDELPGAWAARNAAGWDDCLDRLTGAATGEDRWRPRFERYAAAFEPVLGPQEGPPAEMKK